MGRKRRKSLIQTAIQENLEEPMNIYRGQTEEDDRIAELIGIQQMDRKINEILRAVYDESCGIAVLKAELDAVFADVEEMKGAMLRQPADTVGQWVPVFSTGPRYLEDFTRVRVGTLTDSECPETVSALVFSLATQPKTVYRTANLEMSARFTVPAGSYCEIQFEAPLPAGMYEVQIEGRGICPVLFLETPEGTAQVVPSSAFLIIR